MIAVRIIQRLMGVSEPAAIFLTGVAVGAIGVGTITAVGLLLIHG